MNDLVSIELHQLMTEEIDDRFGELARLVEAAGFGEKIGGCGANLEWQRFNAVGIAATLDDLADAGGFGDFVLQKRSGDQVCNDAEQQHQHGEPDPLEKIAKQAQTGCRT